MRASLIVSMLCHVALLLAVHRAFPINWAFKPLKTYHVELLRPPVERVDEEEKAGADLAEIKPDSKVRSPETEDTINLNTQDKRYSSYAAVVKERLMGHWTYPKEALDNLVEGHLYVLFSLNRTGHLQGIKVTEPSGHEILDNEAVRTIQAAAPFPPFPGSVTVARLNIQARFDYRLTTRP